MQRWLAMVLLVLAACATGGPVADELGDCSAPKLLKEGDRLPECRFETLDGSEVVATSDLLGKPTLLNFWASWCLACQKEMPALDRYASETPEVRVLGVDVIGLQGESLEAGRRFFESMGVSYESLADRDGRFYGLFGATARPIMPFTIVVDAEGTVAARRFGELTFEEIRTLVDEALAA
ncbi:MAG: TlpA family protein disulfide reductase [Actinomycetota bacterium]